MDANVAKIAFTEAEVAGAVGCSRRTARQIARDIGRRIGARRVVLRVDLERWLAAQPQGDATKETHRE